MSFLLRIIIGVFVISLLEYYFIRKIKLSVREYFPHYPLRRFRKIAAGLLIFFNLYPAFLTGTWIYSAAFNTGRIAMPQNFLFDYLLTYPFWIGIMIIVQSSLFFILFDLVGGLLMIFSRRHKALLRSFELKLLPIIALGFLIYVPFRVILDYHSVKVNEVVYLKENLPDELRNFKLVFISDIQADKYTNRYRLGRFIEKVNRQSPDLVLIAGDLITGSPTYIDLAAEYTGKIKAKYGVYTCIGDHDNWAYREDNARSIREITEALGRQGIKMINNSVENISYNGKNISITFVTNTYVESINYEVLSELTEASGTPDLKIFLTHQPRLNLIQAAYNDNYDLYLAGHTHGGQITFIFPFINLSPTLLETSYVRGEFEAGDMMIYVTSGLGMSIIPIRFNSTPEITVIRFKKR
jgi:uncharacterized protein